MRLKGGLFVGLAACLAACAAPPPPDIPVGPLGVPLEIDSDRINSFICGNEKHFTIAYLADGIIFSTGLGVQGLRISGSTQGVRYDGGHFTIVTTANRAVVYYDGEVVWPDCYAVMQ